MHFAKIKSSVFSSLLAFELALAVVLFACGVYAVLSEEISLPGRYGGNENLFERPATFFVGCLPITFSILIFIRRFLPDFAEKYGAYILLGGAVLFVVGFVLS